MQIKCGIAGLGRLGKVHAQNIIDMIPEAKLIAACSIVESELEYARNTLQVSRCYDDFDEMIKDDELEAVIIVTSSQVHNAQIQAALKAGKHVFCEKPLGTEISSCFETEKVISEHPNQVFMLGFMRRFDRSYQYAMDKITNGEIGTPYLFKGVGIDPLDQLESSIPFLASSGGIFIDLGIHDIDLMRWFLKADPVEVFAVGGSFIYPEISEIGDVETACAMYRFDDGKMAILHCGRAAMHGYHIESEIIGTEGTIRVSAVPQKNLAMIYNQNGAVQECVENFMERFSESYLIEMKRFFKCILQGTPAEVTVQDGIKSLQIAKATAQALKTGQSVRIVY